MRNVQPRKGITLDLHANTRFEILAMESVPTETTMYIITYHAARDRLIGGVIVVMHPMNGIPGIDNH